MRAGGWRGASCRAGHQRAAHPHARLEARQWRTWRAPARRASPRTRRQGQPSAARRRTQRRGRLGPRALPRRGSVAGGACGTPQRRRRSLTVDPHRTEQGAMRQFRRPPSSLCSPPRLAPGSGRAGLAPGACGSSGASAPRGNAPSAGVAEAAVGRHRQRAALAWCCPSRRHRWPRRRPLPRRIRRRSGQGPPRPRRRRRRTASARCCPLPLAPLPRWQRRLGTAGGGSARHGADLVQVYLGRGMRKHYAYT